MDLLLRKLASLLKVNCANQLNGVLLVDQNLIKLVYEL